jgi:hypothetical protein
MRPPPVIADLIDARRAPTVFLTTDRRRLLLLEPSGLPPLLELAQPELRLAGLRINPRNHGPSRAGYFTGITVLDLATRERRESASALCTGRRTDVTWRMSSIVMTAASCGWPTSQKR